MEAVSRYAGYLALLGIAALVTFTFGLGSVMWSSERQGLRLRRAYMRALMASEIGYHDTARTAEAGEPHFHMVDVAPIACLSDGARCGRANDRLRLFYAARLSNRCFQTPLQ